MLNKLNDITKLLQNQHDQIKKPKSGMSARKS